MRKKLNTHFPAARIKKIMQADEDVGKIALAVPVLVSKSLELFLQDLCDRTYEITLEREAKTMSSLHLKHCVERNNIFDFLRKVVSKVPDYGHAQEQGHGHGDVTMGDHIISKRRNEVNDSNDEYTKGKMKEMGNGKPISKCRRGRRRGRSRGGRAAKTADEMELETAMVGLQENEKDVNGITTSNENNKQHFQSPNNEFDLNAESLGLSETKLAPVTASEFPGWPIIVMGKIDPAQLASLGQRINDEEEDYDEEL